MISIVKNIFSVKPYKANGAEIKERFDKYYKRDSIFYNYLPEYCLSKDGKIKDTRYYLQFAFSETEEYILLDIFNIDPILNEEILNAGIELLNENINYNEIVQNKKINILSLKDFNLSIATPLKFQYTMTYSSTSNFEGLQDNDMNIEFDGYYDYDMNFNKFK